MVYIIWFILALTAILVAVNFVRSLIKTLAEQGYEAAKRMFFIRTPIFTVIVVVIALAKILFVDFELGNELGKGIKCFGF